MPSTAATPAPTPTRTDEHWVVEVIDPRDLEKSIPGYKKRFQFYGEEAAQRAWVCWAAAEKAGFTATTERVKKA